MVCSFVVIRTLLQRFVLYAKVVEKVLLKASIEILQQSVDGVRLGRIPLMQPHYGLAKDVLGYSDTTRCRNAGTNDEHAARVPLRMCGAFLFTSAFGLLWMPEGRRENNRPCGAGYVFFPENCT